MSPTSCHCSTPQRVQPTLYAISQIRQIRRLQSVENISKSVFEKWSHAIKIATHQGKADLRRLGVAAGRLCIEVVQFELPLFKQLLRASVKNEVKHGVVLGEANVLSVTVAFINNLDAQ